MLINKYITYYISKVLKYKANNKKKGYRVFFTYSCLSVWHSILLLAEMSITQN